MAAVAVPRFPLGEARLNVDWPALVMLGQADERLHVENVVFNIDQVNDGFVTSQVGDRANEVRYRRVR